MTRRDECVLGRGDGVGSHQAPSTRREGLGRHQTRISLHAIDAAYDRGRRNKRSMCRDVRPGGRSMRWISVLEMTCGGHRVDGVGEVAVPPRTPSRRRKVGRRAQTPSGIILK